MILLIKCSVWSQEQVWAINIMASLVAPLGFYWNITVMTVHAQLVSISRHSFPFISFNLFMMYFGLRIRETVKSIITVNPLSSMLILAGLSYLNTLFISLFREAVQLFIARGNNFPFWNCEKKSYNSYHHSKSVHNCTPVVLLLSPKITTFKTL